MSPYDDGWLLLDDELAVETALNDPRTMSVATMAMNMALVCSKCHVILKRMPWDGHATSPAPELAGEHHHGAKELDPVSMEWCRGGGAPAIWHPIAED